MITNLCFPPPVCCPSFVYQTIATSFVGKELGWLEHEVVLERRVSHQLLDTFKRVTAPEVQFLSHLLPVLSNDVS